MSERTLLPSSVVADTIMRTVELGVAITEVAARLGCSTEALRRWRRRNEVDTGQRPRTTSEGHAEVRRLKREVAELKRANDILSTASAFLASRGDHPSPR